MAFGLSACGIKGPPVPPPPPDIALKRIGEYIYIKPNKNQKIKISGFKYVDGIFVKKDKASSCFEVKDSSTNTSAEYCVPPAIEKKPIIVKAYRRFRIHIFLTGYNTYRLYKHKLNEGFNPFGKAITIHNEAILPPDFSAFCYSITGIYYSSESSPSTVCFKRQTPPIPQTPQNANFSIYKNKIYIYWEPNQDDNYTIGYLVYKNDKLLTKHPIRSNVFVDNLPKGFTVYKIEAVGMYNTKSKPAKVYITLKALKQMLGL